MLEPDAMLAQQSIYEEPAEQLARDSIYEAEGEQSSIQRSQDFFINNDSQRGSIT